MTRIRFAMLVVAAFAISLNAQSVTATFNMDVSPILQKNCQTCHRPGQMAPMSFLDYKSARPWAKAMKAAVASRKMPPWFADAQNGHFINDRSLKQADIDTIARWADSGAAEGDPKDPPVAVKWPEGWMIQPDVIVNGPATDVPASPQNNVVEWISVTVPTGFTKDTWITSVEIRPEHPEVTHHICMGFGPHIPNEEHFVPRWVERERDADGSALPEKGFTFGPGRIRGGESKTPVRGAADDCYLPGNPAADYRIVNAAKFVPAGSDILLSLHYTPNGTAVTDHLRIGFTVTNQAPARRYVSFAASSPFDSKKFAIPPGAANWQSPAGQVTFLEDAELVYLMPHMHMRGKDMTYTLEYPDGRKEVVLNVPRYDFNWQLGYNTSVKVPKGSVLRVDAHFDNSPNNKFNPNPNKTVYYGEMTWEEMMVGFFGVVVDPKTDPSKILQRPAGLRPPAGA